MKYIFENSITWKIYSYINKLYFISFKFKNLITHLLLFQLTIQ